jgi:deoxyribodipyrimidine photolyase-related protein
MPATIIYPHQLFLEHPALQLGRIVYLVEEPLFFTHNTGHVQRLLLHRLSLQAYRTHLESVGYTVHYLEIKDLPDTETLFKKLHNDGVKELHIVDTTDNYLERAIATAVQVHHFTLTRYESPLFILPKGEATERYLASKRLMGNFYKKLRQDKNILMDRDQPQGGAYSFDSDNRQKLPKNISLPTDITCFQNKDTQAATAWLGTFTSERYGEANTWIPYTHAEAQTFLKEFLQVRFADFGPYEDALTTSHTRLFHSTLSPLINIGLLTPTQVLDAAMTHAKEHDVPINSLEGFFRQILGWREFIRAAYEVDGTQMRTANFFAHRHALPSSMWTGTTGVLPLDHSIKTALEFGYTHHIERLMVMGNFMLLTKTDPDEVYRWFMGMYVDAYDWVMVPNVYGMSQFSDGGLFATKPYISGASYLKKMSDYPKGDWEDLWTALYWNFINTHQDFFSKNFRLSMMPKLLAKMAPESRDNHLKRADAYLSTLKPLKTP